MVHTFTVLGSLGPSRRCCCSWSGDAPAAKGCSRELVRLGQADEKEYLNSPHLVSLTELQVDVLTEMSPLGCRSDEELQRYFKFGRHQGVCEPDVAAGFPAAQPGEFSRWFPGLKMSRTECQDARWTMLHRTVEVCLQTWLTESAVTLQPAHIMPLCRGRWRVLCFPNAGNSEDMFTSEGTGARRASNPLLVTLPCFHKAK